MNKDNRNELNLRSAFPDMPQDCRDALLHAARSVKEEKKMKHFTAKTVLIAALIIIATMATALAAGQLFGWRQFFPFDMPDSAKEILDATPVKEYRVGPVTFTVQEMLTDGHIAMAAATVRMTDGSEAVMSPEVYDAIGANGENGRAWAARVGLPPETCWIDAAHLLNRPFYRVDMYMEVPEEISGGEAMGDPMWDGDGNCVLYDMPSLNSEKAGDILPVKLRFIVTEYDAAHAEPPSMDWTAENWEETCKEVKELKRWEDSFDVTLNVPAPVAEKTYFPASPFDFANGLTLNSVTAEQTVAGAYVTGQFTLREGFSFEDAYSDEIQFLDENGQEIRWGVACSGIIRYDELPRVDWGAMLNLDHLPDVLTVCFNSQESGEQAIVTAGKQ